MIISIENLIFKLPVGGCSAPKGLACATASLGSMCCRVVYFLPKRKNPVFPSGKGYGLKCPGWWECSLASISQTTSHMHGHHKATLCLAWVTLGRELRALALSYTASVQRGTA